MSILTEHPAINLAKLINRLLHCYNII